MSVGIGAKAYLEQLTETSAIYKYCAYDDNFIERRNEIYDGRIILNKSCFNEYPKLSISEMLSDELMIVENCSNCWSKSNDEFKIDIMALRILIKIFKLYALENKVPEQVFYYA